MPTVESIGHISDLAPKWKPQTSDSLEEHFRQGRKFQELTGGEDPLLMLPVSKSDRSLSEPLQVDPDYDGKDKTVGFMSGYLGITPVRMSGLEIVNCVSCGSLFYLKDVQSGRVPSKGPCPVCKVTV